MQRLVKICKSMPRGTPMNVPVGFETQDIGTDRFREGARLLPHGVPLESEGISR